jgi:very-short-patch-repair endonuclease
MSSPGTWGRERDTVREHRKEQTPAEAALWDLLRGRRSQGLKFRRQHAIGPYIVDFYCAAAQLVIEVDGSIHEQQREDDADRTAFLETKGLRVLRYKNEEVLKRPGKVLEAIEAFLAGSS